jgi:endonuclease-3
VVRAHDDQLTLFAEPTPREQVDPRQRLRVIHDRLCAEYGCPVAYFHSMDPLSELVSSFINHRTRNRESGAAFKRLRATFPTWADLANADVADIERALHGVRWPEMKAPRLKAILRTIHAKTGGWSLDFLGQMPVEEALDWLKALPGVGPKTAAACLSFSTLRRRALPVDSHHHRVAKRLGLIGPTVGEGPAHAVLTALLPAEWDAQQVYDHHEVLMFHGQRCCHWRSPACGRCVLRNICPSADTGGD